MTLLPSDLLALYHSGVMPDGTVAFDTETSGLFVDDGARVATVSVAWEDPDGTWLEIARDDALTWNIEQYAPDASAAIVSVAWPFDQGVAGTGKSEDHGQMTLFPDADNLPEEEWRALLQWLYLVGYKDDLPNLTAHNAKFDVHMVRAGCRRWPGVGEDLLDAIEWDTQIGCDLLYPLFPTALKPTCGRLFGSQYEDESHKVKSYLKAKKLPAGRWDLMPWDIVGSYADMDPRLTLMLRLRQEYDIEHGLAGDWLHGKNPYFEEPDGTAGPEDVERYMNRRLDVMRLLTRMEWRGIPYDEVESRLAAVECLERAAKAAQALPFRPTLDAAKDYYFTETGLNMVPYSVTERGAPQMTEEIVQRMLGDDVPFIREWAEYRKATNAASMWYEGYADKMGSDGRLRTSFKQNGTVSTRFSVERVNLQAIPQDYRLSSHAILEGIPTPRALIASSVHKAMPGWKLWELDLAQAELRVAAVFAGCTRMLHMIERGQDLHDYTTEQLFHMGHEHPSFFKYRQVGKRGNFSLIFGSGGDTFRMMISKETGIRLEASEAHSIVRRWNALYPEFGRAIDRHMERVTKRQIRHNYGWVDLINGERRWFGQHEDAHKAFNQRVQPNLAQFGIDWMLATDEIMRAGKVQRAADAVGIGGAGLLLTIHDSQVLLVPDNEYGEGLVRQAQEAGRELWKTWFPDVPGDVDAKVWSK